MSSSLNLEHLINELKEVNNAFNDMSAVYTYTDNLNEIIMSIEKVNETLEKSAVVSRNTLEKLHFSSDVPKPGAPTLPYMNISGEIRVIESGWLHIKLNTLLPHCRFQTPQYLSDTIFRLLEIFKANNGKIPFYKNAMLIIDEHCDIKNRTVYDQDNKGWKAVSNVLKGRVFPDDDQFSLGIALVSTFDEKPSCNIYIIDALDAGDFFNMRSGGSLYW